MLLRELEIKNYRSLEHVQLKDLGRFNVLIGRNNSGKSAIFGALALLNAAIRGGSVDWATVITAKDPARSLEIRLLVETRQRDREDFVEFLCTAAGTNARQQDMRNS